MCAISQMVSAALFVSVYLEMFSGVYYRLQSISKPWVPPDIKDWINTRLSINKVVDDK